MGERRWNCESGLGGVVDGDVRRGVSSSGSVLEGMMMARRR